MSEPPRGFGYWLNIFANLAVVGGIVFLGMELQQNARATRAEIRNAIAESSRTHSRWTAENPEIVALDQRWERGEPLEETELRQVMAFRYALWKGFENAYYQYTVGTFDDVEWEGYRRNIGCWAETESHARYLAEVGYQFSPAFIDYVHSLDCVSS